MGILHLLCQSLQPMALNSPKPHPSNFILVHLQPTAGRLCTPALAATLPIWMLLIINAACRHAIRRYAQCFGHFNG